MSTLNVNTINAATSGQAVAVDVKNPRSLRNLIINGAMNVAQRGTSSGASGYQTVDRWNVSCGGENETPTQAQHALTSSDTGPWEEGFRNSLHITNGNQTSTDGSDNCELVYTIEAQDIASSGWDYTSASSYITLSFWIKSSVAQNFYGYLYTRDGTNKTHAYETGSLTADTWTKVTKSFPGHADISFVQDNGQGLTVDILPFYGTNLTDNSVSLTAWQNKSSSHTPDNATTWWTTNNATIEITGVQLEVGSYATDFEHRSYAEELARCQRYYQNSYAAGNVPGSSNSNANAINLLSWADGNVLGFTFMGRMRAAPTVTLRSPNATTVARLDSSGTDRVAAAQDINEHHVKYISVTSGANTSWASVCYELAAEL